ncbi:MAG: mechanosensitive ion channel [Bacteroidetes bacterium]|nr:mechanosensitive ion channel [Bacteroidota bacterium]
MKIDSVLEKLKNAFLQNWNEFIYHVPDIILAILIIAAGFFVANFITKHFKKVISKKSHDPLMINFLYKAVKTSLLILIIMFALNTAGLSSIAAGILTAAGASALILGFAFKDIGENFISGVILSFSRPFNLDDTVKIDEIFGKVKALEFRYTKVKTFDGRDVYIPNSDIIKKAVYNYTEDGFFRLDFIVGIAYEDNIEEARQLISETVRNSEGVIDDESHEVFVTADELAVSTVNLKVFFWVKTIEYRKQALLIKSKVITNVKNTILEKGLSLPADITEVKLYGSETSIPVLLKKEE